MTRKCFVRRIVAMLSFVTIAQVVNAQSTSNSLSTQEFCKLFKVASAAPVYEQFARGVEVNCTSTVRENGNERSWSSKELLHGEFWKQISTSLKNPTEPKKIYVRNASYSFQVSEVSEGKYLLTDVTAGVKHPRFSSIFCSPYADRWMGRTLLDIVTDPDTVVHRVVDTQIGGKPVYEVAVSFQFCSHSDESKSETYNNRYFFLKENFLLIASCDGIGLSPYTQSNHTLIEYSDNFDAIRRIQDISVSEQKVRLTIDFEVTSFTQLREVDPTEFQLTHYGIPEPIGEKPTDPSSYCLRLPIEEMDIGRVNCGEEVVVVPIENASNQSRRLLGVEAMCDSQCCYGPLDDVGTAIIPANQTYLLSLKILINRPGPFIAPVKVYLEDYGLRTVTIKVSGEGLGDAKADD